MAVTETEPDTDDRASVPEMKRFELEPSRCQATTPAVQRIFNSVYKTGAWGVALTALRDPAYYYQHPLDRKSASGGGSDLGTASAPALDMLAFAISSKNVRSMIDVPCGDVNFQFSRWETDSLDAYVGLDIVPELVRAAKRRYEHHSNKRFAVWDVAHCALPLVKHVGSAKAQPVDLVHMRDVLQVVVALSLSFPQSLNATPS